jgi:hypothetical protein
MPWELKAIPAKSADSLGDVAKVQDLLRSAIPAIELYRDASGLEKLQEMESRGIEVPDPIREHWLRSKGNFQGFFQGDGFTIEFDLGENEMRVTSLIIDVRGSGDPMSVINQLQTIKSWEIVDVNGLRPSSESWSSFGTWRDGAIRQIDEEPKSNP